MSSYYPIASELRRLVAKASKLLSERLGRGFEILHVATGHGGGRAGGTSFIYMSPSAARRSAAAIFVLETFVLKIPVVSLSSNTNQTCV